jgi:dTMP kinase
LARRASAHGLTVATFSFPRYGDNAFSQAIARYLNGEFGSVGDVPAEFAALLYAGDRLAAREELRQACRDNDLVLCDRYVPSNMAHQAAKISPPERAAFLQWLSEIEYGIHQMPKADLLLYLDLPVPVAMSLVHQKDQRAYTQRKADIHEADPSYLHACKTVYDSLVEADRDRWIVVPCLDVSDKLRTVSDLADTVWARVASDVPS